MIFFFISIRNVLDKSSVITITLELNLPKHPVKHKAITIGARKVNTLEDLMLLIYARNWTVLL